MGVAVAVERSREQLSELLHIDVGRVQHVLGEVGVGAQIVILRDRDGDLSLERDCGCYKDKVAIDSWTSAAVLGASALESTRIMLNSVSRFWPNGLGNSSGVLGHYLMDNIVGPNITGLLPQLRDKEVVNEDGKASGIDIVAYRNIDKRHPKFLRSYVHEGSSGARLFPTYARTMTGYGAEFKKSVRSWYTSPLGFNTRGEMLARYDNYIEIDKNVVDAWGIPALKIHCRWSDNEIQMARDARENLLALFKALGAETVRVTRDLANPGAAIHDMGTARMGQDPKKSILNKYNQAHDVNNLFVVDGAAFVTSGGYGPTLTIGALAARASAFIVQQMRRRDL